MGNPLNRLLANKLKPSELKLVYKSYDIIGDIAIIRIPEALKQKSEVIGEAVMQTHKRVKSVWRQVTPVSGDLRLRELEWIMGKKRTETIHREHGCVFKVDLRRCYFSPRLSYERMRITSQVQSGEVIVNMFAGVGCYSIMIAKHSEASKIFSIDINPVALQYMRENVELNKVKERIFPLEGDAKKIIDERLRNVANRVLMPLPKKAYEYLDCAVLALKLTKGLVHYYDFEHASKGEKPVEKVKKKVGVKLEKLGVKFEIPFGRIVRPTGPNWYQVVLDTKIFQL